MTGEIDEFDNGEHKKLCMVASSSDRDFIPQQEDMYATLWEGGVPVKSSLGEVEKNRYWLH